MPTASAARSKRPNIFGSCRNWIASSGETCAVFPEKLTGHLPGSSAPPTAVNYLLFLREALILRGDEELVVEENERLFAGHPESRSPDVTMGQRQASPGILGSKTIWTNVAGVGRGGLRGGREEVEGQCGLGGIIGR